MTLVPLQLVFLDTTRAKKFAIAAGKSILVKYHTQAEAENALEEHKGILEYWAASASVSVDNSPFTVIDLTKNGN